MCGGGGGERVKVSLCGLMQYSGLTFELSLGSTSIISRLPAITEYQYNPASPGRYTVCV